MHSLACWVGARMHHPDSSRHPPILPLIILSHTMLHAYAEPNRGANLVVHSGDGGLHRRHLPRLRQQYGHNTHRRLGDRLVPDCHRWEVVLSTVNTGGRRCCQHCPFPLIGVLSSHHGILPDTLPLPLYAGPRLPPLPPMQAPPASPACKPSPWPPRQGAASSPPPSPSPGCRPSRCPTPRPW